MSSNEIYYLQNLIIPQPKKGTNRTLQEEKEEKIQEFLIRARLSKNDEKIAIKALEETFWKVDNALRKYEKDQ